MPSIIIIDKTGSIKESNVKSYKEDELYKKAGFKTADGFELATSWDLTVCGKKYFISVYGKKKGRAGQENKYDFPPPIDTTLFFGSCILVNHPEGQEVGSLTETEWEKIYEHLFGGFEDLGSEDSDESDDEEDEYKHIPKTKDGYAKDGFVVDDKEVEEDSEEDEDDSEQEPIVQKPKKTKKLPKWAVKPVKKPTEKVSKKKTLFDNIETDITENTNQENIVLECSDELKEEEYI